VDGLSVNHVLAIVATADLATPEATEFLRVLAALRALDRPVELVETGDGVGAFADDADLTPDGERYFEALVEDGVVPRAAADLEARIEHASDVLVLADRARTGVPPLVRWNEIRGRADAATVALGAGRFVRR
jgi:hypothetical protein